MTEPSLNAPMGKRPSPAAERMRRHRKRRRNGLRSFNVDLRETEIEELIRRGLLNPADRHEANSVVEAFYAFLEQAFSTA
jgi:hypothetical protein